MGLAAVWGAGLWVGQALTPVPVQVVLAPAEAAAATGVPAAPPAAVAESGGADGPATGCEQASVAQGAIDLNRASPEELEALPGIGPALAQRIVGFRETFGPFRQVDDLLEVRGIGPKLLERLKDRVRVDP